MIDKDIIIDSININKCEYASTTPSSVLCYMRGNKCKDNPNCHYKQLTRKTQECEQKEKELKELKHQYKLSCLDCEYKNTKRDVDRYSKTLDEIEQYLDAQQKYFDGEDYHNLLDIINKVKE